MPRARADLNVNGLDYSEGRPDFAALRQSGYSFVMRYLPVPGSRREDIDRRELKAALKAGVQVGLIFESLADRALGGHAAGVEDAQIADKLCAALGVHGAVVFFAVDFDITNKQKPAMADYFRGVESVLGHERTGGYGGYFAIRYLVGKKLCAYYWQTLAWSDGLVHPKTHIYQRKNGGTVAGVSVDFDVAIEGDKGLIGGSKPAPTGKIAFTRDEAHTLRLLMNERKRGTKGNSALARKRRANIRKYKRTLLVYLAKLRLAAALTGWERADRRRRYAAILTVYKGGRVAL